MAREERERTRTELIRSAQIAWMVSRENTRASAGGRERRKGGYGGMTFVLRFRPPKASRSALPRRLTGAHVLSVWVD